MLEQQIGFVGAGQMACALARGFVQAGLVAPQRIVAFDVLQEAAERFLQEAAGARILSDNVAVAAAAEIVVLAVKPQSLPGVLAELQGSIGGDKLVVSIVAGTPLSQLINGLETDRVVRVMPNTPCLVGRGASGFSLGEGANRGDAELVGQLLRSVGVAYQLPEALLDAVTGLSGSGPAFVYTIIESLSDGGVQMGLPRATALALAAQTVLGAAEMVLRTGEHPAVLRDRVTSPGGTTIAGLRAMEERATRAAMMAAVEAAARRSRELGGG
jgi:pyrroline-5-carboxylate reductase